MTRVRVRNRSLLLLLAVLVPLFLVPVGTQVSTQSVFPGEHWQYVPREDLQAYGWSPEALREATAFIRDHSNTTGLVVVDRGRVVFRYGDIEELSYVASVRKSILSMLYGYWVENGTIKVNTTLADLNFDDIGGLLPIEKQASIEDSHHGPLRRVPSRLLFRRRPGEGAPAGLAEAGHLHALQQLGLQRRRRRLRAAYGAEHLRRAAGPARHPAAVRGLGPERPALRRRSPPSPGTGPTPSGSPPATWRASGT